MHYFAEQKRGTGVADASLPYFDEEDLLRVRTRIYEAMGDLDELHGALMAAARRLGASHVMVYSLALDAKQGFSVFDVFATHVDLSVMRAFARESGVPGPYLDGLVRRSGTRPGSVLIGDQMCSRVDALQSPWQSVFIPNDCGDPLSATFAPIAGRDASLSSVTFWRSRKAPRFELDAADRLRLFARDLERMTRIALTLRAREQQETLLAAALDRFADSVFLLRDDQEILYANRAATALLSAGGALAARDRKLAATNQSNVDCLAHAVARAARHAESCDLFIPRGDGRPVVATVAPIPGEAADRVSPGAAAIVIVADPDRDNANPNASPRRFH
jgi:PAS domain-containing protein